MALQIPTTLAANTDDGKVIQAEIDVAGSKWSATLVRQWEDSSTPSALSRFVVPVLGLNVQGLPWQTLCALGCQSCVSGAGNQYLIHTP